MNVFTNYTIAHIPTAAKYPLATSKVADLPKMIFLKFLIGSLPISEKRLLICGKRG